MSDKITNREALMFCGDKTALNILRGIAECCREDACFDCPACYPDVRNYPYCSLHAAEPGAGFLDLPAHHDYLERSENK